MKEFNKTFNRVFVTGDIHGDVFDLEKRVKNIPDISKDDLLIILGDCAFFYNHFFGETEKDFTRQDFAVELPITILCVQGNHEVPFKEMPAKKIKLLGGDGYESHGIYFAENGTELMIKGKKCLIIGGAYSVDKEMRLRYAYGWWGNEELLDEELAEIEARVTGKVYDFVLTHTCPYSKLPREVFLPGIDQSKVSNRMENALERIKNAITFDKWFCGHFHTEKIDGEVIFLFGGIRQIV
ncbi:MAG: metallophosphatase family protein [Firmicutes bacterium]|nr:metallophosphatase family protein [Bacillota bacterium]